MSDQHPYRAQPAKAFWRQTVSGVDSLAIGDWYTRKWPIDEARVATAGSCFAQHIGRQLRGNGFNFVDAEPPPPFLRPERWQEYGYGMYSARYGNVYSTRQLLQLLQRALGEFKPAERAWRLDDGFVDPFRPTIEPQPLASEDEVEACRRSHLAAVAGLFERTDVFVFTLGLTEVWVAKEDGAVFPVCPGTHGGSWDESRYRFVNLTQEEVRADLMAFVTRARAINPSMRFLLTVSPVPLTATATQRQVVVASTYSKSVLRSVAGLLSERHPFIDYFPSYEIIASPPMRGAFFAGDMRAVTEDGVAHVMKQFFAEHAPPAAAAPATPSPVDDEDAACDELLLDAFGEGKE